MNDYDSWLQGKGQNLRGSPYEDEFSSRIYAMGEIPQAMDLWFDVNAGNLDDFALKRPEGNIDLEDTKTIDGKRYVQIDESLYQHFMEWSLTVAEEMCEPEPVIDDYEMGEAV